MRVIIGLIAMLALVGCSDWSDNPRRARAERAEEAKGEIVVGAVWPWEGPKGDLWAGIQIAVEEINGAGGVGGRKLRIVKADDKGSLAQGRLIAQEFADNKDMVAVIGHLFSFIALPASSIYQGAGLLYITPGATASKINAQGFDLVFRSIVSNRNLGTQMADYMAHQKYKRVVILYEKTTNTQALANFFEQRARSLGLTIVDRRRFLQGSEDFGAQISAWKDLYNFDAIFLGARLQEGSTFISQARKAGITVPIITGEGLDTPAILQNRDAEGVVVPEEVSVAAKEGDRYRHFLDLYRRSHAGIPGTYPVVGYDAVHLLVHAMKEAKSTVPDKVAVALRATKGWYGAAGELSFDAKGDIPDKKIGYKVVRQGRFVDLRCEAATGCVPVSAER